MDETTKRYDLVTLSEAIRKWGKYGYTDMLAKAVEYAQLETASYIYHTHPSMGFDRSNIAKGSIIRGTRKRTLLGSEFYYTVGIYASYFARWYNTGAKQHTIKYGKRKGQLSTYYPARGAYFNQNKVAIEEYFARKVDEYMTKHIPF